MRMGGKLGFMRLSTREQDDRLRSEWAESKTGLVRSESARSRRSYRPSRRVRGVLGVVWMGHRGAAPTQNHRFRVGRGLAPAAKAST